MHTRTVGTTTETLVTQFGYDASNRLVQTIDALGRRTESVYDELGRLIYEARPTGERTTRRYDAAGNLVESVDYTGRRTSYRYDELNRLIVETRPDGTSVRYAYTVTGQLSEVTDQNGITRLRYDEQDRLVEIARPGGLALRYGYDAEGRRTRLEAPSGTTSYEYDVLGRLERIVDAGTTNDAALLKACLRSKVSVRRGLNLMVELVVRGSLERERALSVARAIRAVNPFITEAILADFEALLSDARRG